VRLVPLLLLAAALLPAAAQARVVEDQQVWANATVIGTIGPRFAYFMEVQPRTVDGVQRIGQVLIRPAIGWRFSDAVTAYGGYARVLLPTQVGPDNHENRAFAQLSWNLGELSGGRLSSRTRVERRQLSTGDDTGWRVREMLRWVRPLGDPKRPRLLLWMEGFAALNDTDWGARGGFDQARTFLGLELPLGRGKSTLEPGYLNQVINDPGGRVRVNHVASLTLWIRP